MYRDNLNNLRNIVQSAMKLESALPADVSSPSAQLGRGERQLLLSHVLERLPQDYREVIVLRNLEELSHAQVAERMKRFRRVAEQVKLDSLDS